MEMKKYSYINAKKYDDGSYESLEQHTFSILVNVKEYLDNTPFLEKYSTYLSISQDELKKLIFNSIFFHDIGKATEEFQTKLKEDSCEKIPHALHSAIIISNLVDGFIYADNLLVQLAILTHHSKYHSQLYKDFLKSPKFMKESIREFISEKYGEFAEYFKVSTNKINIQNLKWEISEQDLERFKPTLDASLKYKLAYKLINGLLRLGDWVSSAKRDFKEFRTDFSIEPNLIATIKEKGHFDGWNSFQERAKTTIGDIIIKAGTGSGKTEAALLWAQNNLLHKYSKIIYTLPTQTTNNKMYSRLKKAFKNKQNIGIVHSAALDFFEDEEFQDEYSLIKTFINPITITTLDSLLMSFIPQGVYTQRLVNLNDSLIILDEIHAYDLQILGILIEMIKLVKPIFNFKICVISATLPNSLKNELMSVLSMPKDNVITDEESYSKQPYYFLPIEKNIFEEDVINEILKEYHKGKKVIVRLNTVARSIQMYRKIRESIEHKKDALLFNSNFIVKDKIEKEEKVQNVSDDKSKKGFVLISTSIIQISLDIDYDIMFTELCPIDDLIQSGGRINRKCRPQKAKIFILLNPDSHLPYSDQILKLTKSTIEENYEHLSKFRLLDNNKMIEKVYSKISLSDMKNGAQIFNRYYRRIEKINLKDEDIKLRRESYATCSVILDTFREEKKTSKFSVNIPFYIIKKYPQFFDDEISRKLKITKIPYSSEEGLQFLELKEQVAPYFDNMI